MTQGNVYFNEYLQWVTRVCEATLHNGVILDILVNDFRSCKRALTAGLKLNSMTSPTNAEVILFGLYIRGEAPLMPTRTLVLRSPPIGSPFGGEVLGEAVFAFASNASMVFPVVGLQFN